MPVPTVAGLAGETVAPTPTPPARATAPALSTAHRRTRAVRDNPPPPPPALIVPPPHDSGLETRIKQLRDQQADICSELAQLLPLKYGTNFKLELEMLQHKRLVLEAYAREQSKILSFSVVIQTSISSSLVVVAQQETWCRFPSPGPLGFKHQGPMLCLLLCSYSQNLS